MILLVIVPLLYLKAQNLFWKKLKYNFMKFEPKENPDKLFMFEKF